MEPGTRTRILHEDIAAGRFSTTPRQHAGSSRVEAPDAGKHNLPAPRSSFVGREAELRDVKRDLAMTRLLTLTGVGGCGKTRLALEVARELVGAYPDGVWLVELAPLSEGALVAQAVAAALGVQEQPDRSITEALVDFLRARRALLVLDNCEHLLDAVARLADVLLNSCPHLKVLATSRENLNIEGELIWVVPSLSSPGRESPQAVEELAGYDSVRLFVERAGRRSHSFSLTPENSHAVARICGRLEGIPLAIELAAARVGTLSLEQISERLGDSLELLTRGGRTAVARQRTLKGALDWSHDLLSEPERALFRRLSVFAGGWTLEASEAVGSGRDVEEARALDLLSGLVEKSLVVGEPAAEGEVRHRLLEPIRQYALKRLVESGEAESVRLRHASFFLALSEEAEAGLWGPEEAAWLSRLEAEHDNLRGALSWSIFRLESELGLRIAGALRLFWYARGHIREGRGWLEAALEKDGGRASTAARAKAVNSVGWLAVDQADFDRAEAAAREGINLSGKERTKGSLAADFRDMLGMTARIRSDYERAKELFEESLVLNREAGNKRGLAFSLFNLGEVASDRGEHERAKELFEEAGALCRELGDTRTLPKYYFNLGNEYLLQGDPQRATELLEEAVKLLAQGRTGGLNNALDKLGWAALMRDEHERAKALYTESLDLSMGLGDKWVAVGAVEGLACAAAAGAEAERAARLFGAAEALQEAVGGQHMPEEAALREPYLATARSRLDEASWEDAWAEGRTMSMEQAMEYALSEEKPVTPPSPDSEQPSSDGPSSLTPREKEVAILVARGLTNRQIASELVLSEHTVHHHVTNILKKLNLTSRQQIASHLPDR